MNTNIIFFAILIIIDILFAIIDFRNNHAIIGSVLIAAAIGLLISILIII